MYLQFELLVVKNTNVYTTNIDVKDIFLQL